MNPWAFKIKELRVRCEQLATALEYARTERDVAIAQRDEALSKTCPGCKIRTYVLKNEELKAELVRVEAYWKYTAERYKAERDAARKLLATIEGNK